MTTPAELPDGDPAGEDWHPAPPRPYVRHGLAGDVGQALRYVVATPLVMVTFYLDACAEVCREASNLVARVSHRIEGDPS